MVNLMGRINGLKEAESEPDDEGHYSHEMCYCKDR